MSDVWQEKKIEEICLKVISGGTPLKAKQEYYKNGTIPWLKTGEVKQGYIYETSEKITESGLINSSAKLIPANSIIIAMYGDGNTAGHVAISKIELTTNQACCNLILNEDTAFHQYIFFYLKGSYDNLVNLKLGGSQQNLNAKTIKNFPVRLPSLPIQRKIAAILSAYDDLIENNNRRIALLEKMAEEIYREWFVRLRFPGHEGVKKHKGIPEGWNSKKLAEITEVITKGTTPTTFGKSFQKEGINFIKIETIESSGQLNENKLSKIDESTHQLLKRSQLCDGDILFSIAGQIGVTTFIKNTNLPANTNQALAIIRSSNRRHNYYLYRTVRSKSFLNFSLGRVVQTAQANVSLSILASADILLPPEELIEQFNVYL